MPKYYCDYCDIFLTHDSPSVRRDHNSGWKHMNAVIAYYRELSHDKTQDIIDQLTKAYDNPSSGNAYGARFQPMYLGPQGFVLQPTRPGYGMPPPNMPPMPMNMHPKNQYPPQFPPQPIPNMPPGMPPPHIPFPPNAQQPPVGAPPSLSKSNDQFSYPQPPILPSNLPQGLPPSLPPNFPRNFPPAFPPNIPSDLPPNPPNPPFDMQPGVRSPKLPSAELAPNSIPASAGNAQPEAN